ncbi:MAG: cyclic nucleotide-binding protein, partial [Spirochaetes bacterium]
MDSIKHLMRLGLVKKIEKDGVVFEQGPNAILLSDVSIQRGRFWNLAEFPVLHMLYRQGMAIPGHPGNSGIKPILTGLPQRAEAVLSYIYRGTYGLVTEKEMLDEGIPEDQLEELWRLKLKFASGGIKTPHELVDVKSIKKGKVRLSQDVTLIRDSENQYTFKYRNETVSVDMNLPEDKDWTASYTLNNIDVPGGYFSISHIGEGNGWDPERPCMGSIVTYRGNKYLIDAGPGIDYSLEALGCDISEIQGLFVTHVHDDHFAGLTCLLRG